MEFPTTLTPHSDHRAGRMLDAGHLVASVKSAKTGEHITIKMQCCQKNDSGTGKKWPKVELRKASHVFVSVPRAGGGWDDKVGTFYPRSGKFYTANHADPARVWAAAAVATWVNQGGGPVHEQVSDIFETDQCGRCGKDLTDPVSIQRGIGPECYGKMTGSQHETKYRPTESEVIARDTRNAEEEHAEAHVEQMQLPTKREQRAGLC